MSEQLPSLANHVEYDDVVDHLRARLDGSFRSLTAWAETQIQRMSIWESVERHGRSDRRHGRQHRDHATASTSETALPRETTS